MSEFQRAILWGYAFSIGALLFAFTVGVVAVLAYAIFTIIFG